jgi:hypothetical protein
MLVNVTIKLLILGHISIASVYGGGGGEVLVRVEQPHCFQWHSTKIFQCQQYTHNLLPIRGNKERAPLEKQRESRYSPTSESPSHRRRPAQRQRHISTNTEAANNLLLPYLPPPLPPDSRAHQGARATATDPRPDLPAIAAPSPRFARPTPRSASVPPAFRAPTQGLER